MQREMKDSRIEWIGEIPADWKTCRLKDYAHICNGRDYSEVLDENGDYPVIGSGGPFAKSCKPLYQKESVLLGRKGTIDKPLYVDFPFWTVDTMYYTEIKENVSAKHFYYLCTQIEFDFYQYGSAVPSMTQRDLYNVNFPYPTLDEQRCIVDYLDHKCSQIDTIIVRQQEVIEKLKAYKLSVITEAVTKGLDPNIPMKDSGVEWIGSIPEGWETASISRVATVVRGASPRPAGDPRYFNGQDVPWITVAEVTKDDGKYITSTEDYLTEEGAKYSRQVEKGTLLLSNSGATLGVPKVTLITGCINDGSVAFLNLKIEQMYLLYVFKSRTLELRKQMQGYGQPNLNTTIIKSIVIPLPQPDEQKSICMYLDNRCKAIDDVIAIKEKIVSRLVEYKKSLIYEVVTGKQCDWDV